MGQKLTSKPGGGSLLNPFEASAAFHAETATRGVLWKKMFLEVSQNSQENTCPRKHLENTRKHLGVQLY